MPWKMSFEAVLIDGSILLAPKDLEHGQQQDLNWRDVDRHVSQNPIKEHSKTVSDPLVLIRLGHIQEA